MISQTLTQNITNITELKKNPVELSKHKETCILSNGKPCFYSVSPARMAELLEAEKLSKDQDIGLYTAYDCAVSALELNKDRGVEVYLLEIINCYMEGKE